MIVGAAAVALVIVAGLNGPLALCAVSLALLNGTILNVFGVFNPEFMWFGSPWLLGALLVLLVLQFCADLYFVPITVQDRRYLHPRRTENAYIHARAQSLLRPLCAALVAAVLLPEMDWIATVLGFCGGAAIYWFWAWVREFVARTRGTVLLLALETAKNILLVPLTALAFWWPLVAVVLAVILLVPTAIWTARLQREYQLYAPDGGRRAGEDA